MKGDTYIGVKELAEAAEEALKGLGANQEKSTVTEYPNERTVRFYITEGLLPPAVEKQGSSSVFAYKHLLALIAIKKLQSEGLPISIIRTVIDGKTESELEKILGEPIRVEYIDDPDEIRHLQTKSDGELTRVYGETVQKIEDPKAIAEHLKLRESNAAKEYLEGLLFPRSNEPVRDVSEISFAAAYEELEPLASVSRLPRILPPESSSWNRFEIEPGLELHVQEGYKPPDYREGGKLISRIKGILGIDKRR